ncbi:DUF2235 domain-containing protein [Marinobacter panjinensis]|uniref:DUF2235 domain-containing protein n=1 Tax=Marinobacter panjinensis TaxID=2576384 RepID=A0A4U6R2D8_9GAMM|nr:DUF2235 domain-containing protein [Marinobacter panjinensis]MCR8913564.1 DUF2235 domain-containing protein [Marinobacter panjinensis]TKV67777.1 DUF2235 domain-containing protein [Marinobacter panjinensis]
MKLVRSRDLTAYDLPRIESPFLAASKVQHLLADPFSALQLPQDLPRKPYGRNGYSDTLQDQVRNGELLLVHGPVDGFPVSPVVSWQPGEHFPGGGQWKVNTLIVGAFLENDVAKLNEWAVTPEQLRGSNPAGIGGFRSRTFGIDMQIRHHAENRQRQSSSGSTPTLPLGSAASVMPLPATSSTSKNSDEQHGIHLEVGIFTDGTLNNATNTRVFAEQLEKECLAPFENEEINQDECERRIGLMSGASYTNEPSNVAKLRDLYTSDNVVSDGITKYRYAVYEPGVGSKTGSDDNVYGAATGLGNSGVIRQVERAFSELSQQVLMDARGRSVDRMTIDLFGFSRGAAAARHAANEIRLGRSGELAKAFEKNRISWPDEVRIRFVALFDCVAGIANWPSGDLFAHNEKNSPVKLYLDPDDIGQAVHLTAMHERRKNFALNSLRDQQGNLPDNFREIALPGAHSDIGGGYSDNQREEVLVSPMLPVSRTRLSRPEQTMQWDNLELLRKEVAAEGWIGQYSLPVRQSEELYARPSDLGPEGKSVLEIFTDREAHPAPDGQVDLALRMVRQVRGEYSRVALRLMHRLAVEAGLPLREIPDRPDLELPTELADIHGRLLEQVLAGNDSPSLANEDLEMLLQRYIHYSAHYNSFETLIAGLPARVRLFRLLRPHKPVSSGERLVYPQQEDK